LGRVSVQYRPNPCFWSSIDPIYVVRVSAQLLFWAESRPIVFGSSLSPVSALGCVSAQFNWVEYRPSSCFGPSLCLMFVWGSVGTHFFNGSGPAQLAFRRVGTQFLLGPDATQLRLGAGQDPVSHGSRLGPSPFWPSLCPELGLRQDGLSPQDWAELKPSKLLYNITLYNFIIKKLKKKSFQKFVIFLRIFY
jgi:hypothetical protein